LDADPARPRVVWELTIIDAKVVHIPMLADLDTFNELELVVLQ
jgi:hypothetical protein